MDDLDRFSRPIYNRWSRSFKTEEAESLDLESIKEEWDSVVSFMHELNPFQGELYTREYNRPMYYDFDPISPDWFDSLEPQDKQKIVNTSNIYYEDNDIPYEELDYNQRDLIDYIHALTRPEDTETLQRESDPNVGAQRNWDSLSKEEREEEIGTSEDYFDLSPDEMDQVNYNHFLSKIPEPHRQGNPESDNSDKMDANEMGDHIYSNGIKIGKIPFRADGPEERLGGSFSYSYKDEWNNSPKWRKTIVDAHQHDVPELDLHPSKTVKPEHEHMEWSKIPKDARRDIMAYMRGT